jgi:hypothetical protein
MKTTIIVTIDTDTAGVIPAVTAHIAASLGTLLMVNDVSAVAVTEIKSGATTEDTVFQASIDFIKELTGMEPPPIETADAQILKPFRDFTKKVCALFADPEPQAVQQDRGDAAAQGAAREPLTDAEIVKVIESCGPEDHTKVGWIWRARIRWVRAIEAAHGIGTPPQGVDHG